jgi:hypothetical protein
LIAKVFEAFRDSGPDIQYIYQDTDEWHPSYARLMTMTDDSGRNWTFLGSEESYARVREMQLRNLIVPVVGDFAGPKALRGIGDYVREHGAIVNVFYVSNVEPYLFQSDLWRAFYENVATLPVDETSVFVRTFFGSTIRDCPGQPVRIRAPVRSSIARLIADYRNGEIRSQCGLVERSE